MAARSPRPVPWPMLLIGVVVLALLAAAIAIAGLPLLGTPAGSPSASVSGDAPTAAQSDEPDEVDASSFLWANASMIPPPAGRDLPVAYALQGGTLADREPVLDLGVPFVMGAGPGDVGRVPAISEPTDGAVVYAADDGNGSQVRRATLSEPVADELMLELEPVVWAIAVSGDGGHAYALLVDRDEFRDAGVVRVALDGSGQVEQVLGPAEPAAAGGIRQVAILGSRVGSSCRLTIATSSGECAPRSRARSTPSTSSPVKRSASSTGTRWELPTGASSGGGASTPANWESRTSPAARSGQSASSVDRRW